MVETHGVKHAPNYRVAITWKQNKLPVKCTAANALELY